MKSMKLFHFKTFMYIYNIIQNRKSLVILLVKLTDSASKAVKLTVSDNGIIQHFKLQQARDLQFFVSK